MINELILWAALAVLIALLALAVWAGRRGLHALGVVGPKQGSKAPDPQMDSLIVELRRLNDSLEKMVATGEVNIDPSKSDSSTSDDLASESSNER